MRVAYVPVSVGARVIEQDNRQCLDRAVSSHPAAETVPFSAGPDGNVSRQLLTISDGCLRCTWHLYDGNGACQAG